MLNKRKIGSILFQALTVIGLLCSGYVLYSTKIFNLFGKVQDLETILTRCILISGVLLLNPIIYVGLVGTWFLERKNDTKLKIVSLRAIKILIIFCMIFLSVAYIRYSYVQWKYKHIETTSILKRVNGNPWMEYNSLNGVYEGIYREYYENGKMRKEISYHKGKYHGPVKDYYESGKIREESLYVQDVQIGPYKFYYENGQLSTEGQYKNNKKDGIWKNYYENGKLKLEEKYIDGAENGLYRSYYENGNIYEEGNYKDGKVEGEYKWFFDNGKLSQIAHYKDGKKNGLFKNYYENGNLNYEKIYVDGIESGQYKGYYDSGEIQAEVMFRNGLREGPYKTYYKNGQVSEMGIFKGDNEEGAVKNYYENGKLNQEVSYVNGVLDGAYKVYNENGYLVGEGYYKLGKLDELKNKEIEELKSIYYDFFRDYIDCNNLIVEAGNETKINYNEYNRINALNLSDKFFVSKLKYEKLIKEIKDSEIKKKNLLKILELVNQAALHRRNSIDLVTEGYYLKEKIDRSIIFNVLGNGRPSDIPTYNGEIEKGMAERKLADEYFLEALEMLRVLYEKNSLSLARIDELIDYFTKSVQ